MTDYGVLFRELAIPRLAGTPNHQKVREVLKRELAARGFSIEEHAFSGRPARALLGTPKRISGINLIARPIGPSAHPPIWLVAHYDSKGQPISMWARLVGFVALVVGLVWLPFAHGETWFVIPLAMGFSVLLLNRVTDKSPGAIDNASALVTVFMTLDQLPRDAPVGIIFPDAEEYGLVGSRALRVERAELFTDAVVINLDGIDDVGRPVAFMHRAGPMSTAAADALEARRARWLPVVVDGIALAHVARECVTIMKGNAQTMTIVHTPHDTVRRVRLDGAALVAAGLARVLRGL